MTGYNGYPNYETWCVSLWIDNDEGLQRDVWYIALDYGSDDAYDLAHAIQGYMEDLPDVADIQGSNGFVTDLFGSAWQAVDWHHIAENWIATVVEEAGR